MGDNVYLGDRNGVRTPMQWSADRNAGFSRSNPQRLILPVIIDPEYHYESLNVEAQQQNPNSLLWWTKRMIALRREFLAFGRGSIEFLSPENPRVLAFVRAYADERVLVVANLSRNVQYVELDLSRWRGMVPIELSGRAPFPAVGDLPYLLTLGGYGFYWFSLEAAENAEGESREAAYQAPAIRDSAQSTMEELFADYLEGRRWFRGGERQPTTTRIVEQIRVAEGFQLVFARVEYARGEPETFVIPISTAIDAEHASEVRSRAPQAVLALLPEGILYDPLADVASSRPMLEAIAGHAHMKGRDGELVAGSLAPIEGIAGLEPRALKPDHPNAIVNYGNEYLLKVFRRLDEGVRPELELGRFFARHPGAPVPRLAGQIEYRPPRGEPITIATLHEYVPNEGDAWSFTQRELKRFFERVLVRDHMQVPAPVGLDQQGTPLQLAESETPQAVRDLIGAYLDAIRLLGQRVAQLHATLASDPDDPAFAPERYTTLDQRSTYQAMRNTTGQVMRLLRARLGVLPPSSHTEARDLLEREPRIYQLFEPLLGRRITTLRIRRHGDLQLGSVLYTGKDFVIIDFDGKRDRPLVERRRKRSPLRDVAGLLRSLQHAAFTALNDPAVVRASDRPAAAPWAWLWYRFAAAAFLRGYFDAARDSHWLPDRRESALLLDAFLLDKALRELRDDLEQRPEAAAVSLDALLHLLPPE
jgi:maltose alpha-D-glucosyltransferase/alpha-amylase